MHVNVKSNGCILFMVGMSPHHKTAYIVSGLHATVPLTVYIVSGLHATVPLTVYIVSSVHATLPLTVYIVSGVHATLPFNGLYCFVFACICLTN